MWIQVLELDDESIIAEVTDSQFYPNGIDYFYSIKPFDARTCKQGNISKQIMQIKLLRIFKCLPSVLSTTLTIYWTLKKKYFTWYNRETAHNCH